MLPATAPQIPAGKTFSSESRDTASRYGAKAHKQLGRREGMAPLGALKVLLATRPRALLRSTLTAPTSANSAPLRIACGQLL